MRRSTILLLSFFLLLAMLATAHYAGLRYMVNHNMYTVVPDKKEKPRFERFADAGVRVVEVNDFYSVWLVIGNTFYYTIYEDAEHSYQRKRQGDSVVLDGGYYSYDTTYIRGTHHKKIKGIDTVWNRYRKTLVIHITGNEKLLFRNADVMLEASPKNIAINMEIDRTDLGFSISEDDSLKLDRLQIAMYNYAALSLDRQLKCKELDVVCNDYGSISGTAEIGSGRIVYNDSTDWGENMKGYMLHKLKLVHGPFKPY